MKTTVGRLRKLVNGAVDEAKVGAHASYLKKEQVREALQAMIVDGVRSGEITSQKDLDAFIETVTMATSALKMVPFDVYKRMSHDRR
jgi:hypothetical protein